MGTWGYSAFENDAALDWVWGLEKVDDLSYVEHTLRCALDGSDEELGFEEALIACEVLARLRGNWGEKSASTEELDEWVTRHPLAPPEHLLSLAQEVIDAAINPSSELRDAWDESGESKKWLASVEELRRRLLRS